jgi:8-oxo-dGTP pyrophosphatase MutT (NUDIX family)
MSVKNEILPAVAAIIFNERGEVLLQKRKDVGKWSIISGHVEYGETVTDALLREIWEETNVRGRLERFIGVYSSPTSQTYRYTDRNVHYVTLYFEAALNGTIPHKIDNPETLELKYFPVHGIPDDFDKINPHWLEDALARRETPFMR